MTVLLVAVVQMVPWAEAMVPRRMLQLKLPPLCVPLRNVDEEEMPRQVVQVPAKGALWMVQAHARACLAWPVSLV